MSSLQIADARGASAARAEDGRVSRALGEPRAAARSQSRGTDMENVVSTVSKWHYSLLLKTKLLKVSCVGITCF